MQNLGLEADGCCLCLQRVGKAISKISKHALGYVRQCLGDSKDGKGISGQAGVLVLYS